MKQRVKKALIYGSIAVFLLLVGFYVYGSRVEERYPEYSTYNSSPKGARALYLLAGQMKFDSSRYDRPARFLADKVTMVAIKPDMDVFNDSLEKKYLKAWLDRGNTLVLLDDISGIERYPVEDLGLKFKEEFGGESSSSVYSVGSGKLIFIDEADNFTNEGLKKIDPGVEFINALDAAGNKTVFFNEYYHGTGSRAITIWDLMGQTGHLVFIQLLAALVILLYILSRRSGKPVVVFEVVKRQENENLFALSSMYIKARAGSLALETYLRFFKKQLSKFLGFGSIPEDHELLQAVAQNKFLSERKLGELLNKCKAYVELESKDNKQLLHLMGALEKIRKGIGS